MTSNKSKGNMYPWVDETRNPLGGRCGHNCSYCYIKSYPFNLTKKYEGITHWIDYKELNKIKGNGKTIFICSANDLFSEKAPKEIILKILERCRKFPENTYLFQTKNPMRYFEFDGLYPPKRVFGTTLESDRFYPNLSNAPPVNERHEQIASVADKTMISIEPILDFDLKKFVKIIKDIKPDFVSVGADSKKHNLPEPSPEKTRALIKELEKFTEVKLKDNLKRLL